MVKTFVETFTNKYSDDSETIYKAKISADIAEAQEKVDNIKNIYKLFDDSSEENLGSNDNIKSQEEIEIEQKIEKYNVRTLFKKLGNIKSQEELRDLTEEYSKAFEEIQPISSIKTKRHMKEYVAIFAALRTLQELTTDKQFEPKDLQKQFETSFKQHLKDLTQHKFGNARTNQLHKSKRHTTLNSLLTANLFKAVNIAKNLTGNIAFIMSNAADQAYHSVSGSMQGAMNYIDNIIGKPIKAINASTEITTDKVSLSNKIVESTKQQEGKKTEIRPINEVKTEVKKNDEASKGKNIITKNNETYKDIINSNSSFQYSKNSTEDRSSSFVSKIEADNTECENCLRI